MRRDEKKIEDLQKKLAACMKEANVISFNECIQRIVWAKNLSKVLFREICAGSRDIPPTPTPSPTPTPTTPNGISSNVQNEEQEEENVEEATEEIMKSETEERGDEETHEVEQEQDDFGSARRGQTSISVRSTIEHASMVLETFRIARVAIKLLNTDVDSEFIEMHHEIYGAFLPHWKNKPPKRRSITTTRRNTTRNTRENK
jgi:hypothetical protein